ncbi:MAG: C-GCAxxG-C-C family protein [Burkholderiales bacterium]|jgi:C_GCAxxG_C_C family probable redox protein|nr:C-GCAxxG-C-C family protein [Burkholderiales bacterium]
MESRESKVSKALECFDCGQGFNCAQVILSTYCEDLGLNKEAALRLSCGFGAGMGRLGYTCGAVSGAHLVIGLKYGNFLLEDKASREKTYALVQEFEKRFIERNRSTVCKELLQIDLMSDDKQAIRERVLEVCPRAVKDAAEILESVLFSADKDL